MTTKTLETLWQWYPESHLHCDVTLAGENSYQIVMSLIDREGEVVTSIDYYGSGDLDNLKNLAAERLVDKLQHIVAAW
jgi:hypothetical protein